MTFRSSYADSALLEAARDTMRKASADQIKWNYGPTFDASMFIDDG